LLSLNFGMILKSNTMFLSCISKKTLIAYIVAICNVNIEIVNMKSWTFQWQHKESNEVWMKSLIHHWKDIFKEYHLKKLDCQIWIPFEKIMNYEFFRIHKLTKIGNFPIQDEPTFLSFLCRCNRKLQYIL
jgi:hypothetical protein